jgi:hypothetical protein
MLRITIAGITIESDSPVTAKLPDGTSLAFGFPEAPAVPTVPKAPASSPNDFSAVLKAIEEAGPSGISRKGLSQKLTIRYHRLHYVLHTLIKKGQITYVSSGSPSSNRWMLPEHAGKAPEGKNLPEKPWEERSNVPKEILAVLAAAGPSGMTVDDIQKALPGTKLITIYVSLQRLHKSEKLQKIHWPYEKNNYYYANNVLPEPPASKVEGQAPRHKWPSIIITAAKTFVQQFTTEELYNHLNKSVSKYAINTELKASPDFRISAIGARKDIVWEPINANNS